LHWHLSLDLRLSLGLLARCPPRAASGPEKCLRTVMARRSPARCRSLLTPVPMFPPRLSPCPSRSFPSFLSLALHRPAMPGRGLGLSRAASDRARCPPRAPLRRLLLVNPKLMPVDHLVLPVHHLPCPGRPPEPPDFTRLRHSSPCPPASLCRFARAAWGVPLVFLLKWRRPVPGQVRGSRSGTISQQVVPQLAAIASLSATSSSLNSLFRVLCIFRLRYLCSIGLPLLFSLGWSIPPSLGCTVKQPDSPNRSSSSLCTVSAWFQPEPLRGSYPLCRLVPKDL